MKRNVSILLLVLFTLVISTFLIDFHYADAYTVEELIKEIAKCAAIEGDLGRLEAYDNLAQSLGVASPTVVYANVEGAGKWEASKEVNPIDDSTTIIFVLKSDGGKSVYGEPIYLILRYKSKETEVYISWNSYLGDKAEVMFRLGNQKAFLRYPSLSTDSQSTFYGSFSAKDGPSNTIDFIRELIKVDSFVAQVTPYNENPITAVFDTRGLRNAVEQFNDILHWIKN